MEKSCVNGLDGIIDAVADDGETNFENSKPKNFNRIPYADKYDYITF